MKRLVVYILIFLPIWSSFAQCTGLNYIFEDSLCIGDTFNLDLLEGEQLISFDPSCGESLFELNEVFQSNITSSVSTPRSISIVKDDSTYLGFTYNANVGNLFRIVFDTSLTHVVSLEPVYFSSNTGPISSSTWPQIKFVQEGSNWFGLCANSGSKLIVLDFGNSLLNDTIDYTEYSTGLSLSDCRDIDLIELNGEKIALVTNRLSQEISVCGFGGSYANSPSLLNVIDISFSAGPQSLSLVKDCFEYKFILTSLNDAKAHIGTIDSALTIATEIGMLPSSYPNPQHSILTKECGKWIGIIKTRLNGNELHIIDFGEVFDLSLDSNRQYENQNGLLVGWAFDIVKTGESKIKLVGINSSGSKPLYIFDLGSDSLDANVVLSDSAASGEYQSSGINYIQFTVEDSNHRRYHYVDSVFVSPNPQLVYDFTEVCLGDTTLFSSQSTIDQGFVASTEWDFGDGSSVVDGDSVEHEYTSFGSYQGNIKLTSNNGCIATDSFNVTVFPIPEINLTSDTICRGEALDIQNNSSIPFGNIEDWFWILGNDTLDTIADPINAVDTVGTIQIDLVAISDFGCVKDSSFQVFVKEGPVSGFLVDSTCLSNSTIFTDNSNSQGSYTVTWDFGDGNGSNLLNPTHVYQTAGSYEIMHVSQAANGCTDTLQTSILISPSPQFSVEREGPACESQPILIYPNYTSVDSLNKVNWSIGSVMLSQSDTFFQGIDTSGTFTMYAEGVFGTACKISDSVVVKMNPGPKHTVLTDRLCLGDSTNFQAIDSIPSGQSFEQIVWSTNNQTFQGDQSFEYLYPDSGLFAFRSVLSTDSGCTDTVTKQIRIVEKAAASIMLESPFCTELNLNLNPILEMDDYDSILTWMAFISKGSQILDSVDLSTQDDVRFNTSGDLELRHQLQTGYGCIVEATTPVKVAESPALELDSIKTCVFKTTAFKSNYSGSNYEWNWLLPNGFQSSFAVPSIQLPDTGRSSFSLVLTDKRSGCVAYDTSIIEVYSTPELNLGKHTFCSTQEVVLKPQLLASKQKIDSIVWINPANGLAANSNPIAIGSLPSGSYNINSSYFTDAGCVGNKVIEVEVLDTLGSDILIDRSYGEPPFLLSATINHADLSHYHWTLSGDTIDTIRNLEYTIGEEGEYKVEFFGEDQFGCRTYAQQSVFVFDPYIDLELERIISARADESISFRILNNSNIPIDGFQLQFSAAESNDQFRERFSRQMLPGQAIDLESTGYFTDQVSSLLCTEIIDVSFNGDFLLDQDSTNNKACLKQCCEVRVYDPFPNPASGSVVTLPVFSEEASDFTVLIADASGRTIAEYSTSKKRGIFFYTIDLGELEAGIYLIRTQIQGETFSNKLYFESR